MDIYEALYTTRAMRRLKPNPIPYDVQARILDAALHAPTMGRMVRSGVHLAEHFAAVPLLLIGFGRTKKGSGIYPALWSAISRHALALSHSHYTRLG